MSQCRGGVESGKDLGTCGLNVGFQAFNASGHRALIGLNLLQAGDRFISFGYGARGGLTSFRDRNDAGLSLCLEGRELRLQLLRPRSKVADVLFIQLNLLLPPTHLEFVSVDGFSRTRGRRFIFGQIDPDTAEI
jgi:hypothetical protein